MSESTKSSGCSDFEWQAAKEAGLLTSMPGTQKQEDAIHKFAELIRNEMDKNK